MEDRFYMKLSTKETKFKFPITSETNVIYKWNVKSKYLLIRSVRLWKNLFSYYYEHSLQRVKCDI